MKTYHLVLSLLVSALLLLSQCNTSKTAQGAVIGGTAGGVVGGVIGNKSGSTAIGILLGSAIGGSAGAIIGDYMDKQAKEIETKVEGAEVARVGEGILVTFDSGLLFDFDSDRLLPATRQNLNEMANIMQQYDQTKIIIEGHTDSKGTESYNQALSVRRAESVASFLQAKGISRDRLTVVGYGESQPVASNDNEEGRAQNRRVEIIIVADDSLKESAQNQ
ncbi:MAG: OmpA family protein [Bacteroidetes bacterium]|nr:MAG: OmpA family protein [Bacteroidota bacterium]